jgi:glycosyltransferase involved in cell wall biosynthesis
LHAAAAIHFVSELERMEAANLRLPASGEIIPHGVTPAPALADPGQVLRARFDLPSGRKLVLFLGRIHAKKGLDLLVRALALLPEPRPLLLIAGNGPERPEIERLVHDLHLSDAVRWLGFVEGEEKQICLQGADLFALTSHHENLGMAVLEALAAGTSVLLSPQVALAESIEHHGLGVVADLQAGTIRDGLIRALHTPSTESARAARKRFVEEHHSWVRNALAMEALYREVMQRSR